MRRILDTLYLVCGVLGGVSIVAITAIVMAQVGANIIDRLAALATGQAIGLLVPSYAEFTGFFLVSASFLALPYAFRHGAHIRVGLVLSALPTGLRRAADVWSLLLGLGLSAYAAWWAAFLTWESWQFGDMSSGLIRVPLWLPQSGMALGLIVLAIAMLDDLVRVLRGLPPSFEGMASDQVVSHDR